MHLGGVTINAAELKSLLSLDGPWAKEAEEVERESLAVEEWYFQCFFLSITQTFGKGQGSWLSDASPA